MLGVGFTAVRNTMGMPLAMPPLMPPFLLVAVTTLPSRMVNGSFAWEPRRSAKAKPAPNSMPLTAGMATPGGRSHFPHCQRTVRRCRGHPGDDSFQNTAHAVALGPGCADGCLHGGFFFGVQQGKMARLWFRQNQTGRAGKRSIFHPAQRAMWVYTLILRCARMRSQIEPAATLLR